MYELMNIPMIILIACKHYFGKAINETQMMVGEYMT